MRRGFWRSGIVGALTITVAGMIMASSASANGSCGQGLDASTACPVNTGPVETYSGSLGNNNESNYYVFWAAKGTALTITISDDEAATCTVDDNCGDAAATLLDASQSDTGATGDSAPSNGATVPTTFTYTVPANGEYFVIIEGNLGSDANGNLTPVPYTLNIKASPDVQWPAPCVVPTFKVGARLGAVKQQIAGNFCTVGSVTSKHSPKVHKGKVISLSPAPDGTQLAPAATVNIVISSGPKKTRKHHHHHRHHHRHDHKK